MPILSRVRPSAVNSKRASPTCELLTGRDNHTIRRELNALGLPLRNGAVLIEGEQNWHGSEAIAELSRRMNPSDPLLGLLAKLFSDNKRSALAYPAPVGSPTHGPRHTRTER